MLMNWSGALMAMYKGDTVRRVSDKLATVLDPGRPDLQGEDWRDGLEYVPVVDGGVEGCKLMHAWGANDTPALVFIGADSRQPFIPSHEDKAATDWRIKA